MERENLLKRFVVWEYLNADKSQTFIRNSFHIHVSLQKKGD